MDRVNFTWIIFYAILTGCTHKQLSQHNAAKGELIFQSGFENDVKVVPRNTDSDIIGADKSLPAPNDWVNDLDNHPDIGNFNLQYEGGDSTMRYARIIP